MAGGKSSPIKSAAFQGTDKLTKKDTGELVVTDARNTDHLTPNWLRKARSIVSLHLRPDNTTIDHAAVHLAGNLHSGQKGYQCKNYWATGDRVLTLVVDPFDLAIFSFPPNCLSSSLLDSPNLPHHFLENSAVVPTDTLVSLGVTGFCLRANLYPSHPDWMKLSLTIYPKPAATLVESYPLAISPAFPGLSLDAGGSIHLGPSAAEIFPAISFGSPLAPALVTMTPWDRSVGFPSSSKIVQAVSAFLRTAIRPVHVKSLDSLAKHWSETVEKGDAALKLKQPEHMWPEARSDPPPPEGRTLVLSLFPLLFPFFPF